MDDTDRRADSKGRRGLHEELALNFSHVPGSDVVGPSAWHRFDGADSGQLSQAIFDVHLVGLGV